MIERRGVSLPIAMAGLLCLGSAWADVDVARKVEAAARSGKFDLSVVKAVQDQPREKRGALAAVLAESSHPAMQAQALTLLCGLKSPETTRAVRRLFEKGSGKVQIRAAQYLAKQEQDAKARQFIFDRCADGDAEIAAEAVRSLGILGGDGVADALAKIMLDGDAAKSVRSSAIVATVNADATECTPSLVKLLDDETPRELNSRDTVRLCDLAASALEQIHKVNYIGKPGSYYVADVARRDAGIEIWKKWYADGRADGRHSGSSRVSYLDTVLAKSLEKLSSSPSDEQRAAVRTALKTTIKTRFCLGDLPGIDTVLMPSIRDLWRMLQVTDEKSWHKLLNGWRTFESSYERDFLRDAAVRNASADGQAAAFVLFAGEQTGFERVWVWSLCRDFVSVFPDSRHRGDVAKLKAKLEQEFERKRTQVVLHGRIAVLEPKPAKRPASAGGMVPDGATGLVNLLDREPSNWDAHRAFVMSYIGRTGALPVYWMFTKLSDLYPGNEWLFLADALYQQKVRNEPKRALVAADKALILNPENPKAHALRGMILLASGGHENGAFVSLMRAFENDPKSIGSEPDTLDAALFIMGRLIEAGRMGEATRASRALGRVCSYGSKETLSTNTRFRKLQMRLASPENQGARQETYEREETGNVGIHS